MRWGSGAAAPDARAGQFDGRGVLGVCRAPESKPRQTVESRRQRSSRFEPRAPRRREPDATRAPVVERRARTRVSSETRRPEPRVGPAAGVRSAPARAAQPSARPARRVRAGPQSVGRGAAGGCRLPAPGRLRCSDAAAACCRRRPRDASVPAKRYGRHRRPSPRQQGRRTSAAAASSCPRSRRPPPNRRRATACRSSKR